MHVKTFSRAKNVSTELLLSFAGLVQNATIEERVSLLEIQIADIEGQITDLDQDVNFLFDEHVIQNERLLNLEVATDDISEELDLIDDEFNAVNNAVESMFCIF